MILLASEGFDVNDYTVIHSAEGASVSSFVIQMKPIHRPTTMATLNKQTRPNKYTGLILKTPWKIGFQSMSVSFDATYVLVNLYSKNCKLIMYSLSHLGKHSKNIWLILRYADFW